MIFNSILMYYTLTEERYDYAKKLTAVISDLYKVCKTKIQNSFYNTPAEVF